MERAWTWNINHILTNMNSTCHVCSKMIWPGRIIEKVNIRWINFELLSKPKSQPSKWRNWSRDPCGFAKKRPLNPAKNPLNSTWNRLKIEVSSVKISREPIQDDLGGARGAIFPLGSQLQAHFWSPKSPKNNIKIMKKIVEFLIGDLKPKIMKNTSQILSKWSQNWI